MIRFNSVNMAARQTPTAFKAQSVETKPAPEKKCNCEEEMKVLDGRVNLQDGKIEGIKQYVEDKIAKLSEELSTLTGRFNNMKTNAQRKNADSLRNL